MGSGSHGPFTSMIYHSWNGDFPQQTVKCLGTRHRAPFCWDELSLFWITPKKTSSKCVDHIIQLGITMEYHVALSETYLYNFIHNLWKYLFLMRVSSRFRMAKLIAFLQKEEPPTIDLGWPRHRALRSQVSNATVQWAPQLMTLLTVMTSGGTFRVSKKESSGGVQSLQISFASLKKYVATQQTNHCSFVNEHTLTTSEHIKKKVTSISHTYMGPNWVPQELDSTKIGPLDQIPTWWAPLITEVN